MRVPCPSCNGRGCFGHEVGREYTTTRCHLCRGRGYMRRLTRSQTLFYVTAMVALYSAMFGLAYLWLSVGAAK